MPLNLSVGDGDFVPYLKYNAKAGRFYVKPEGASEEIEIVNPVVAFDMANIRTGWLYYAEGSGPEKIWDPSPTQMAARPPGPKKFKRGFEVMVYGNTVLPGGKKLGLREFSSTAGNVIGSILHMHAAYEAGLGENAGKVPVFKCTNVKPITGAYGVNYEPQFDLISWVERVRIPDFDERMASTPAQPKYDERNPPPQDDFGNERSTVTPIRRAAGVGAPIDDDVPF